ncbi:hypothetical protein BURCENBC7_AP4831 [Burkholderia cenocepacia BC7]|nr:hypothetical protein BURCENK562V_C0413 [Burkholderia cenocepacia K56-2Valvano]ERI25498.1 hypothetical protein BURCENBC7_AP4831 [Burkholderia cenocepacia BC7]
MLERTLRLRVVRGRILRVGRKGGEGPGGKQRGTECTADREGARAAHGGGALLKQLRGQGHGNPFDVSTDCNALATIHARS